MAEVDDTMKRNAILTLTLAALPVFAQSGEDDGPGRGVARVSLINGDASVKRGDSGDWTGASLNSPLVVEDRLFTGPESRAEVQFDFANMLRLAADSEIRLAELEHRRYTVQIARGLVTFRVLRNSDADVEISTPSVAVRPVKRGSYRIEVRPDGTTAIAVRSGEADIYTPSGVERLKAGRSLMARGTKSDPEFRSIEDLRDDGWDRWNNERDRDMERSRSYSYVSSDIYGAEDLDSHGDWVSVAPYGMVWSPRVTVGWAPYRAGRWVWLDWYGWTWVSHDPWGWAPYHYGRWFTHGSRWVWWPGGGVHVRHYWRPALVAFFGWNSWSGFNVGAGVGGGWGRVGWCPLAPYETYRPWYGRGYYGGYRGGQVDNSVHVVNNVNITNIYRNSRVSNGVTAVDGADFSSGRVTAIRTVDRAHLDRASLAQGQVPVAPGRESLRHSDREVTARGVSNNDSFYSRRQIRGVERVSFDEQRRGIEQIARRSSEEGGERRGGESSTRRGAESVARTGEARSADSSDRGGWRRANDGVDRGAGRRGDESATRSNEGRSTDNGGRGVSRASDRSEPAAGRRGEESAARTSEGRSAESGDRGGWRRAGEGSAAEGSDRGSGRTAGDPGARTGGATRSSGDADRGGWRRFGDPGTRTSERGSEARGVETGGSRTSSGSERGGWRRFGDPGTRSSETGPGATQRGGFGGREALRNSEDSGSRRSDEVRVSPSVVRERGSSRSSDSGSWSRPSRGDALPPSSSRGEMGGGRSSLPDSGMWGGRRGGDSGGSVRSAPPDGGGWGGRRGGDSGGSVRSAPSDGGGWGGRRGGDSGGSVRSAPSEGGGWGGRRGGDSGGSVRSAPSTGGSPAGGGRGSEGGGRSGGGGRSR